LGRVSVSQITKKCLCSKSVGWYMQCLHASLPMHNQMELVLDCVGQKHLLERRHRPMSHVRMFIPGPCTTPRVGLLKSVDAIVPVAASFQFSQNMGRMLMPDCRPDQASRGTPEYAGVSTWGLCRGGGSSPGWTDQGGMTVGGRSHPCPTGGVCVRPLYG
jgi:hypothetical protein